MRQSGVYLSDLCTKTNTPCTNDEKYSKFRTITGRCNNVQAPLWGATGIPFRRILSPCKRDFFNTRNTLLGAVGRNEVPDTLADKSSKKDVVTDKADR